MDESSNMKAEGTRFVTHAVSGLTRCPNQVEAGRVETFLYSYYAAGCAQARQSPAAKSRWECLIFALLQPAICTAWFFHLPSRFSTVRVREIGLGSRDKRPQEISKSRRNFSSGEG
jgi:hypothetical protein